MFIDCSFENRVCGLVGDITTDADWEKTDRNVLLHGDHSRGNGKRQLF